MKILISLLFIAILTACGSSPKKDEAYLTRTETIVVKTPDDLLKPCSVTKPIPENDYIQLKPSAKENILSNLIIDLYGDLKVCNDKIKNIREHQIKSSTIIKGK